MPTFAGADSGFFLGGGCTTNYKEWRKLTCEVNKFLKRIRSRMLSQGGRGTHPLHPPLRSVPALSPVSIVQHRQGYGLQHLISWYHLYTWVKKGTVRLI